MSAENYFTLANFAVLPGWAILVFLPRWRYGAAFITSVLVPLLIAIGYIACIVLFWDQFEGGFGSLEQVARLFGHRYAFLAGWLHYLAFDLFIGSWEVRDAEKLSIPHLLVLPCLALTFLLGPAGLTLYFLVRWGWSRRFLLGEKVVAAEAR